MFPYPINTFCGFISKIATIKISTQEKDEVNIIAISRFQLSHFLSLFLPALVGICKIPCRLAFHKKRLRLLRTSQTLYHDTNRHLHPKTTHFHRNIKMICERALLHIKERTNILRVNIRISFRNEKISDNL